MSVDRDYEGVPTIHGTTRADIARATGFVHGQDRFFQMDLIRRIAAGEMAELVGRRAVEFDKHRRVFRQRQIARQVLEQASPEERDQLLAYAAGVNAGLASLKSRPFEYFALDTPPKEWKAEDSVLVILAIFFMLTDVDANREATLGELHDCLPPSLFEFVSQSNSPWEAPLSSAPFPMAPIPSASDYDLRKLQGIDFSLLNADAREYIDQSSIGSNSMAVAGKRTKDGIAMVANDMHLPLIVPNLWYRAHFVQDQGQALDAIGVTLPGLPFLVIGSNRRIAWGLTNSYGDWSDRIILEEDEKNPGSYKTAAGYNKFEQRPELINVKGSTPEKVDVLDTIWGPVIDKDYRGRDIVIHTLALERSAINLKMSQMEQARSVSQAISIANESGVPPQNFLVGDHDGHIGWTIIGRLPKRAGYDSRIPTSWTGSAGWQGWLPPEQYPRIIDPPEGLLWSANQRAVAGEDLARIGDGGYDLGIRARQIHLDLQKKPVLSTQDLLTVELDDQAPLFQKWRDLLLNLLASKSSPMNKLEDEAQAYLKQWDGHAKPDSVGFRLVHEYHTALRDAVLWSLTAECRKHDDTFWPAHVNFEGPLWQLVTEQPPHLLNPKYDSWNGFLLDVFDRVLIQLNRQNGGLSQRTWGEYTQPQIKHLISKFIPGLGWILDMPSRALPGDSFSPRVQTPLLGASERFGVQPGKEGSGYFHMPGGQSGNPLSPYYRRGYSDWVTGTYSKLMPEQPQHTLRLVP